MVTRVRDGFVSLFDVLVLATLTQKYYIANQADSRRFSCVTSGSAERVIDEYRRARLCSCGFAPDDAAW